jgi:hypothetical protein
MSTLDDIAAQRERIADRLARIDAERAKLEDELAELEAAERVVSRFTQPKSAKPRRRRAHQAEATEPVVARGRRGRTGRANRSAAPKPALPLGDAAVRAIEALGNEVSAQQIREYLGRELGMQVRPNHLGMALQRHRRADRLSEHDGRWSTPPTSSGE